MIEDFIRSIRRHCVILFSGGVRGYP
jgi:hypothetical protein